MRASLLVLFCALTLSASAQFWKKKKAPVEPQLVVVEMAPTAEAHTSLAIWKDAANPTTITLPQHQLTKAELTFAEDDVLKDVKHHMRYREYAQASVSFTALATLYLLENRFSEAKWYLLQSNEISREQKDNKHTIANLIMLAQIKAAIGELPMAKADLQEARDLANTNNLTADLADVEKALQKLETNKGLPKAELRYAEAVEAKKKTK